MEAALAAAIDAPGQESGGASRRVVAFSGGLDSSVLLHALASRSLEQLSALHVNHQLHGDAALWQRHCEQQCARWGVPLLTRKVAVEQTGQGLEAAARAARYACFAAELDDGEHLLLAHHLDDQAETLLLRLLRGAGVEGLAAMPGRRALGRGWLLRPLLGVPRSALLAYAREQRLEWIEDPSNADTQLDRNYLRREVMPRLEMRWPGYRRTLARAADHLRRDAERSTDALLGERYTVVGDPGFAIADLPEQRAAAAHGVRHWLRRHRLAMPAARQLERFLEQIEAGQGGRLRTREWTLERYRSGIYAYTSGLTQAPAARSLVLGQRVAVAGVGVLTLACSESPPSAPAGALEVRFRASGERLRQPDGTHLSLKTLFQSHGIPPWWRPRVPLLYAGEQLLALGPFRRAALPEAEGLELCWEPELLACEGARQGAPR